MNNQQNEILQKAQYYINKGHMSQQGYDFFLGLEQNQFLQVIENLTEQQSKLIMKQMQDIGMYDGKQEEEEEQQKQPNQLTQQQQQAQGDEQVLGQSITDIIGKGPILANKSHFMIKEKEIQNRNQTPDDPYLHDIFPFYHQVALIMYASGDVLNNNAEAIKLMHSQIDQLLRQLLSKQILSQIIKLSNENLQNMFDIPNETENAQNSTLIFPHPSQKLKKQFHEYWKAVFPIEYDIYHKFQQTYKEEVNQKSLLSQKEIIDQSDQNNILGEESQNEPIELQDDDIKSNSSEEVIYEYQDEEIKKVQEDDEDEEYGEGIEQTDNQNDDGEIYKTYDDERDAKQQIDLFETDSDCIEMQNIEKQQVSQKTPNKDENEKVNQTLATNPGFSAQENVVHQYILEENEKDRKNFNTQRGEEMTDVDEWNYFMQARTVTLIDQGKAKLLKYLQFENIAGHYNAFLAPFAEFISYSASRVIGKIVEWIVKDRNKGVLKIIQEPITTEEIKLIGNQIIGVFIYRSKKFANKKDHIVQTAFKLFCSEFEQKGYSTLLAQFKLTTLKLVKKDGEVLCGDEEEESKNKRQFSEDEIENTTQEEPPTKDNQQGNKGTKYDEKYVQSWQNLKHYRQMWIERVIAEQQIDKIRRKNQGSINRITSQDLINKYSAYLYDRLTHDLEKGISPDYGSYFQRWFLNLQGERNVSRESNVFSDSFSIGSQQDVEPQADNLGQKKQKFKLQSINDD